MAKATQLGKAELLRALLVQARKRVDNVAKATQRRKAELLRALLVQARFLRAYVKFLPIICR